MAEIYPYPAGIPSSSTGGLQRLLTWVRRRVVPPDTEQGSRVTDEATLRELNRLNEQQLKDIGIRRELKRTKWLDLGRGMAPVPVNEFDYFRLGR